MTAYNDNLVTVDFQKRENDISHARRSSVRLRPACASEWVAGSLGPGQVRACDVMCDVPTVVRAASTLRTAVEMLRSLDIRLLPVVDENGALVGVLGDRELRGLRIPYFIGNEYIGDLQKVLDSPVRRLLSGEVVSVDLHMSAADVRVLMLRHRIASVPVTDSRGVLVGVITYLELLGTLSMPRDVSDAAE